MRNDEMAEALAWNQQEERHRIRRELKEKLKCKHIWKQIPSERFALFKCEMCGKIEKDD